MSVLMRAMAKMLKPQPLLADVRVGETLDALYLTARHRSEGTELLRRVLMSVRGNSAQVSRTADGIRLTARDARDLNATRELLELVWSAEAIRFVENRRRTAMQFDRVLREVRSIKDGGAAYARTLVEDSTGLETLDDHQIVNVAAMTIPELAGAMRFRRARGWKDSYIHLCVRFACCA